MVEASKTSKYVLVGDFGGTQIRMSLFDVNKSRETPICEYFSLTKDSKSIDEEILKAIAQAHDVVGVQSQNVDAAIIGLPGPVDEAKGEVDVMVDVPQWGAVSERELEARTGVKRVKILNDFVVNGYGIAALNDTDDILKVYSP